MAYGIDKRRAKWSNAFVVGSPWRRHRGKDRNESLAPQDDAQEIQMRHPRHSADTDCADGTFAHEIKNKIKSEAYEKFCTKAVGSTTASADYRHI